MLESLSIHCILFPGAEPFGIYLSVVFNSPIEIRLYGICSGREINGTCAASGSCFDFSAYISMRLCACCFCARILLSALTAGVTRVFCEKTFFTICQLLLSETANLLQVSCHRLVETSISSFFRWETRDGLSRRCWTHRIFSSLSVNSFVHKGFWKKEPRGTAFTVASRIILPKMGAFLCIFPEFPIFLLSCLV